jgi:hypothetical protein
MTAKLSDLPDEVKAPRSCKPRRRGSGPGYAGHRRVIESRSSTVLASASPRIVAGVAAIANAACYATGWRVRGLPITTARLVRFGRPVSRSVDRCSV